MDILLSILMILAGLMGAGGIALAAASAHGKPGAGLDSAGYQLLLHAPAVMAGIAALDRGLISRPLGILALAGFVLGSTLFAGDLAFAPSPGVACLRWRRRAEAPSCSPPGFCSPPRRWRRCSDRDPALGEAT